MQTDVDEGEGITVDPVILPVLKHAAELAQLDFHESASGLLSPDRNGEPNQHLLLTDYFRLLHRLAELTNEETMAMSDRPLMAGAFFYVLQQATKLSNFEALIQHFAHSFNMLHGGNYNHVFYRGDRIVYAIDVEGFPYPFDLSAQEQSTLMDCVLILVHTIFTMCVGQALNKTLREIRTRSHFRKSQTPPYQLGFWPCLVVPDCSVFELEYSLSAANLVVDISVEDLPSEYDIYLAIANRVDVARGDSRQSLGIVEKIQKLIARSNLSENEVAARLDISVRTLRRQLQEAKTNFKTIRATTLNEHAKRLLGQNYLVEEVAERLGYSDSRSFRRAFVRWNDVTPHAFQEACKK